MDTFTGPVKCRDESKTSTRENSTLSSPFAFQAIKDWSLGKEPIL